MARGMLRIYLGAAPGVGKTYRMLEEGRRRRERGTDVVIGIVETHGRVRTAEQIGDLEVLPRRQIDHRGARLEELDLDALIARRPQVALIDEFAHTNAPGSRHEKRWEDIEVLRDHGIDVISTLNIQHLESLSDVVREITGTVQRETVPDDVVRRAEQVELVDMAAQALRRRMAHGNVYPADRIDAALGNYFREGNLLSLRELALLWTAGRVDEALRRYRDAHAIDHPWETHERVVVGLDGRPGGDLLLRRGARIAQRGGGELIAVHVARADGLRGAGSSDELVHLERLTRELGGSYSLVIGDDAPAALIDFARSVQATQLVLGSRSRSRRERLFGGAGVAERVVPGSGSIDVHIVSQEAGAETGAEAAAPRRAGRALGAARIVIGTSAGILLIDLLTVVLHRWTGAPPIQTTYLLYLTAVLVSALIGGILPASITAIVASLAVNWYFTEPLYTFDIARPANALALVLFVAFAAALGGAVEVGARRRQQAERAASEAQLLAQLTAGMLRRTGPGGLLELMRTSFGLVRVELEVADRNDPEQWRPVHTVGTGTRASDPPELSRPAVYEIDDGRRVLAFGAPLSAIERRVLATFAAQVGVALDTVELAERAASAQMLAQADSVRQALLASVGHDLRTPLAGIKAAVSSLRLSDVQLSPSDQRELLATIEESADRLHELVRDLLDMSRIQVGAVTVAGRPVWIDEVLAPALVEQSGGQVRSTVDEALPPVLADPVLLERILSNLVSNAVRHGGGEVVVRADALGDDAVQVRVVDRGPGVDPDDRERMFEPFQRLDADRDPAGGVGLGLAVARGFSEALGARLEAEDTPGGGLTMVLTLPRADGSGVGDARPSGAMEPAA